MPPVRAPLSVRVTDMGVGNFWTLEALKMQNGAIYCAFACVMT